MRMLELCARVFNTVFLFVSGDAGFASPGPEVEHSGGGSGGAQSERKW